MKNSLKALLTLVLACMVSGLMAGCDHMPKAVEQGSVTKIEKDGSKIENLSDYAAYAKAKKELADKPLFEMVCPATGCVLASLKVNNPNAAGEIAAPAPPPKQESAWVGVAREVKEGLGIVAPIGMAATVGSTMSKIFAAFGGTTTELAKQIQAPQANVTNNTTTTTTQLTNSGNRTTNTDSGNTTTTTTTTTSNNNTGQNGTAKSGP